MNVIRKLPSARRLAVHELAPGDVITYETFDRMFCTRIAVVVHVDGLAPFSAFDAEDGRLVMLEDDYEFDDIAPMYVLWRSDGS